MKTPSGLTHRDEMRSSFARCAALPALGQASEYKAVWAPVNFKSDLMLYDYFVNDDTGWAVGGAGELSGA